jgi:hypothetical protein
MCTGNICRSPAAEAVFRTLVSKRGLDSKFLIDSAGTIGYHEVVSYVYCALLYIFVFISMMASVLTRFFVGLG